MKYFYILLLTIKNLLLNNVFGAYFTEFSMEKTNYDLCYYDGRPISCIPDFINSAFGKPIIASSTCGIKKPSKLVNLIFIFFFCK